MQIFFPNASTMIGCRKYANFFPTSDMLTGQRDKIPFILSSIACTERLCTPSLFPFVHQFFFNHAFDYAVDDFRAMRRLDGDAVRVQEEAKRRKAGSQHPV